MKSPHSSTLLHQPADVVGDRIPHYRDAPQDAPHYRDAPQHTRSVTRVVSAPQSAYAAPQPMYAPAPQPMYVRSSGGKTSALSTLLMALMVILVGAVALVGGYYATKAASPSTSEAAVSQQIAATSAFGQGRSSGFERGRSDALTAATSTGALRASMARTAAYEAAYKRGLRAGKSSYRRPTYTGGGYRGGGYRAPRYSGYSGGAGFGVASALGQAQNLANITGAPVDVEIY